MQIERFDVFEDEAELTDMITKLQRKGLENMVRPDDFWYTSDKADSANKTKELVTL